jgi:predicted nucleic acid-binding protein
MDPILEVVLSGAAGKVIETAWDTGKQWLANYFSQKYPAAEEKANENMTNYLNELSQRIKELEEKQLAPPQQIEAVQKEPDFYVLLRNALIAAAQTDDKEKHALLSRLVSERLCTHSESTLSLASQAACEAISRLNSRQLRILGLQVNLVYVTPILPVGVTQQQHLSNFEQWLALRLVPFSECTVSRSDLDHLVAVSAIHYEPILTRDLSEILRDKSNSPLFSFEAWKHNYPYASKIVDLWENHLLKSVTLTSIGQIIGVYVSDLVTGNRTNINL